MCFFLSFLFFFGARMDYIIGLMADLYEIISVISVKIMYNIADYRAFVYSKYSTYNNLISG